MVEEQLLLEYSGPCQIAGRKAFPCWAVWGILISPHNSMNILVSLAPYFAACFQNMVFRIRYNLSIALSHSGWWAIVFNFSIPKSLQTSFIRWDSKFVPLSERSASGTLTNGKTSSTNRRAILSAFWSDVGYTIGHLVNRSWNTTTYLLPLVVTIISMPTIWNGCSVRIRYNGSFCFRPVPLTIAHHGQFLAYSKASRYIYFHHHLQASSL